MWRIELTIKTAIAETRMASHRDAKGTMGMPPPGKARPRPNGFPGGYTFASPSVKRFVIRLVIGKRVVSGEPRLAASFLYWRIPRTALRLGDFEEAIFDQAGIEDLLAAGGPIDFDVVDFHGIAEPEIERQIALRE